MKLRWIGVLGAVGCLAYGQTGSVGGPSTGYVFDASAKMLRQVRGIPGAALMGDAMDLGISAAGAQVSPHGDAALAIAADGSAHLFRLSDGAATERALSDLMSAAASVAFSPSGTAAALIRPGSVQILKGLPDSPEVAGTLSLPSAAGSAVTATAMARPLGAGTIAVSDDGAYVLFGHDGVVDLLPVAGGSRKLADARRAGAMVAFAAGGHDAAVVSGGTLSLYQDVAGASTRQDLPSADASVALAFSADGKHVLISGRSTITVLDRASGDQKVVECDCRITGLTPMGNVFRVNEAGSGPVWLLDGVNAEPKMVFIPARPTA